MHWKAFAQIIFDFKFNGSIIQYIILKTQTKKKQMIEKETKRSSISLGLNIKERKRASIIQIHQS